VIFNTSMFPTSWRLVCNKSPSKSQATS